MSHGDRGIALRVERDGAHGRPVAGITVRRRSREAVVEVVHRRNHAQLEVTTYNSLKLNKYDMGKRLFDDTVRKVLNPLNENISAPKAYYGYDIVVYGHTKSFAEKDATPTKVEYRFLLPEAAVRRYKDKDISGQALLDAGVELMDDERVEFKLQ